MNLPIRVVIVDDHPMVAQGIQSVLESYSELEIVGTLNNGRAVVEQLETLNPDVILMDLNMPEMGGLTATELVLERRPGTRVLILSMHDSQEYIASALSHGAMGYILKDIPTDEIKLAIDAVMSGERYLCTGAAGSLKPKNVGAREALTGREQQNGQKGFNGLSCQNTLVHAVHNEGYIAIHRHFPAFREYSFGNAGQLRIPEYTDFIRTNSCSDQILIHLARVVDRLVDQQARAV